MDERKDVDTDEAEKQGATVEMCMWNSTSSSKWYLAHVSAAPEGSLNLIIPEEKLCEKVHSGKKRGHFVSYHDTFSMFYQDLQFQFIIMS